MKSLQKTQLIRSLNHTYAHNIDEYEIEAAEDRDERKRMLKLLDLILKFQKGSHRIIVVRI